MKLIGTWRAGVGSQRACGHSPKPVVTSHMKDASDPEPLCSRDMVDPGGAQRATPTPTWTPAPRVIPSASSLLQESPLMMTLLGVTRGEDTQPACSCACTCHSGAHHELGNATVMRKRESTAKIPPSRWEINLPKRHLGTALQKHSSELAGWMLPLGCLCSNSLWSFPLAQRQAQTHHLQAPDGHEGCRQESG